MKIQDVKLFLDRAWHTGTTQRMEEGMKVSEFVKRIVIPVVSALFFAALFRPLCMDSGKCNYLSLWWFMGIPFGIHRMYFMIIPKCYDIGSTVAILFINVLVGGVIGGIVLAWRLLMAVVYFLKVAVAVISRIVGRLAGKPCRI